MFSRDRHLAAEAAFTTPLATRAEGGMGRPVHAGRSNLDMTKHAPGPMSAIRALTELLTECVNIVIDTGC